MAWEVSLHPEVEAWYLAVCKSDPETADLIEDAIDQLAAEGPTLRRPLADRVKGSHYHNMKPGQGQPLPQHEAGSRAATTTT